MYIYIYIHARTEGRSAKAAPSSKQRKVEEEKQITWSDCDLHLTRVAIIGNSLITVNWVNGVWKPKFREYQKLVCDAHGAINQLVRRFLVLPPSDHDDFARHVHREYNTQADALSKCNFDYSERLSYEQFEYWRVYFDGSFERDSQAMRTGILIQGARSVELGNEEVWSDVARASQGHPEPVRSSAHSEIISFNVAMSHFLSILATNKKRKHHQ